jgi:ABC-type branched-subunit amino acid transport system ATPase component/branched-subunit amino acid ABC-type transport system permease component
VELLRFVLVGLAIGSLYAVAAQGIVLVYRASGIVNFALGGFVMLGGYEYYELHQLHGLGEASSLVLVVVTGALLGLLVYIAIMRPLKDSSPIVRVVATLGILQILQAAATLRYGEDIVSVNTIFPSSLVHIAGTVITENYVVLFFLGVAVTVLLWAVYRFTRFGKATTAVSENELAAASIGLSPDRIAGRNWAISTALAVATGALIAPVTSLQPAQTPEIILPVLAASLLGGLSSFPAVFCSALVIGVSESVITYETSIHNWWAGWSDSLPFLIVIGYLIIRGRGIPLRSHLSDRLPKIGTGRIRPVPVAAAIAGCAAAIIWLPSEWSIALTVTLCYAIVCISVVVVTGYAGQLSLAQYTIGGTGAFIGAKLMADAHVPFALSFIIGVAAAVAVGAVVGVPALRTRGLTLAVATLGIGVAVYSLFLTNISLVSTIDGVPIEQPSIFGWSLNPATHPGRYGLATLIALVLIAIGVVNLRRGAAGRRMLAVRSNERAALALGVDVYTTKLYAFMLSAGIAAIGVCTLCFLNANALFTGFDVFSSVGFVTATVVGGLGMVGGGIVGSTLISGGITSTFLSSLGETLNSYLPLIGGVSVLLVLLAGADGMFEQNRILLSRLAGTLRRRVGTGVLRAHEPGEAAPLTAKTVAIAGGAPSETRRPVKVKPKTLTVEGLSVRFGGVTAVHEVSLAVRPGTVHGLIGPNGAGKTTFIDAVTGFVRASSGAIKLNDTNIESWSARRRSRFGLSRSFQNGELFADLSVLENLAVACDDPSPTRYVFDLVRPGRIGLSAAALMAAHTFALEDVFAERPDSLPFGQRRMVAIARAVASAPSVLLLDEPASGLDSSEAEELGRLIRSLADEWGIGVLLVEHNLDLVLSVCDEITVMSAGVELLSACPPDIVRTDPAVVDAYVGVSDDAGVPDQPASLLNETG